MPEFRNKVDIQVTIRISIQMTVQRLAKLNLRISQKTARQHNQPKKVSQASKRFQNSFTIKQQNKVIPTVNLELLHQVLSHRPHSCSFPIYIHWHRR